MKKSLFLLPLLAGLALCSCGESEGEEGGGGSEGSKIATVTLKAFKHCEDKESDPIVFSKDDCSVTISQGSCAQTIADAVTASKSYEFRIYAGMEIEFSAPKDIKKLVITCSTYVDSSGKGYLFDMDDEDGMVENEVDEETGTSTVVLEGEESSWVVSPYHQVRIAKVAFYC